MEDVGEHAAVHARNTGCGAHLRDELLSGRDPLLLAAADTADPARHERNFHTCALSITVLARIVIEAPPTACGMANECIKTRASNYRLDKNSAG